MADTDAHDIAARYIAAWNETDAGRPRTLIAALWTEDASYVDPMMGGRGPRRHRGPDRRREAARWP